MELKEFVKKSIREVVESIVESTDEIEDFTFEIVPSEGIEFDLAVLLKSEGEGKIGAEIFSVVGAKLEGSLSKENISRMKFKVFVNDWKDRKKPLH